jgi:hypothetical protein
LNNGEDGVSNVIVEAGFELFQEAAREEVIAVTINRLGTERALRGQWGVEER